MPQGQTNRVQKLQRNSDGKLIVLNEGAIIYCQANATNIAYTDVTYQAGPSRRVTQTFRRSFAGMKHSTENLIEVTYGGKATLINAQRIINVGSSDGDEDTAAEIIYDYAGAQPKKLTVTQTLQNVKDAIDALGQLASSVS